MIGKSQIKRIASLQQKKYRREFGLFTAEGPKVIGELLASDFELVELYSTGAEDCNFDHHQSTPISETDLKKISALTTPAGCLAVFRIPENLPPAPSGLIVALDDIRDPGNLGTIIRLCDWFGVKQLICSEETVDVYNPKVVQATMGSLARVELHYCNLAQYLAATKLPMFGAFMHGENIYDADLPKDGMIVLGNESNGISESISKLIKNRITIPRFGEKTESLNVGTAAAIVLSEFRRRK